MPANSYVTKVSNATSAKCARAGSCANTKAITGSKWNGVASRRYRNIGTIHVMDVIVRWPTRHGRATLPRKASASSISATSCSKYSNTLISMITREFERANRLVEHEVQRVRGLEH